MRRFRISALSLAVAIIALITMAQPAAAQTWVQIRYWPTNVTWSITGGSTPTWNANMIGLTLRRFLAPPWSLSFNGDFGGESNWTAGLAPSSGTDSVWNANLHYGWGAPPLMVSIFAGFGRAGWSMTTGSSVSSFRVTGPRVGADLRYGNGPWNLMAWGAVGVGGQATGEFTGIPSESAAGNTSDLGLTVGYMFASGWGVDVGYRKVTAGWGGSTSFVGSSTDWSGLIFGVNKTFP